MMLAQISEVSATGRKAGAAVLVLTAGFRGEGQSEGLAALRRINRDPGVCVFRFDIPLDSPLDLAAFFVLRKYG